ncbi:hypothetical protein [Saccharopolyspora shandongensis]|uniref:hypothetical protein n=1 Tax=Saccharopolyspora shandongensis TaxID=418495 RepID=UPI003407D9BC
MADNAVVSETTTSSRPPTEIIVARWIWFVGSGVAAASVLIAVVFVPDPLVLVLLGGATAVELAVAIPAAVMVVRGARWAQIALLVLAFLSLGSLYSWTDLQAWGSVIFNVILGSTGALLTTRRAWAFFAAHRRHAPGH